MHFNFAKIFLEDFPIVSQILSAHYEFLGGSCINMENPIKKILNGGGKLFDARNIENSVKALREGRLLCAKNIENSIKSLREG